MDMNLLYNPLGFSDDDEEIMEYLENERRPYIVRERIDHLERWDDTDFFRRFRLSKKSIVFVLSQIEESIECPTDRNHAISPIEKLLLTLRFFATGGFQIAIGDFIGVSKASASKIIREVSCAIAGLGRTYISLPQNEDEIKTSQEEFFRIAKVPRVIGTIDCTHIRIQSPGTDNAEVFRNRKGFFSINVQTVSSPNLKVLDIVARWPGSVHDQTIFNNSRLKARLDGGEFGNALIVGDGGYANTMHIITPLINPNGGIEELYNKTVKQTRVCVERQYGVLKRRFPVLSVGLRLKLQTTMAVIVATAVLHNIACDQKEEVPPEDPDVVVVLDEEEWNIMAPIQNNYFNARTQLLAEYFPTLYVE